MNNEKINIDGFEFEIMKFRGREAVKKSLFYIKLGAGALSRFASETSFKNVVSVMGDQDTSAGKINFAPMVDYIFETIDDKEFERIQNELLGQVLYGGVEFFKVWDTKFKGDPGLAYELIIKSIEVQFGFFSLLIPKLLGKIIPQEPGE